MLLYGVTRPQGASLRKQPRARRAACIEPPPNLEHPGNGSPFNCFALDFLNKGENCGPSYGQAALTANRTRMPRMRLSAL